MKLISELTEKVEEAKDPDTLWQELVNKYGKDSPECNNFLEVCRIACITVRGDKEGKPWTP